MTDRKEASIQQAVWRNWG